ncbi:hypothetical protein MMC18_003710 [Xylographa bjoerkii]|nr:hypothetical protein [Xylographa bjoerkii]
MISKPTRSTPATSSTATDRPFSQVEKPQRVLACVLCQKRKIRCNRGVPCSNCLRSHAQCVPAATLVLRQRRRRFPERELLDRLRHYESLLRRSNINFEPLHKDFPTTEKNSFNTDNEGHAYDGQDDEQLVATVGADQSSSLSMAVKSETIYEAKSYWHAMNQGAWSRNPDNDSSDSSPDDVSEAVVKDAWNELYQNSDHLLFGSRETAVDVSTLQPEQVQIFRLWQVYIDNVNPLLKVTHTPTLQARIIDAASNVASIEPALAALMFSIYCLSILSLGDDECRTMFGSPRERLLTRFRFGCQQALLNCGFLRSDDRDCLTALYLYLMSVRPATDPQSLSSMLGVAIRIAQRMGLHNESAYAKYPALEAELRRRLWWSLILFDTRISELADYKTTMLAPTWDCKTPLNLNDFDFQQEMKDPPPVLETSSEALFAVVRSEMAEFVRHSAFHLDFVNPALKAVAKDVHGGRVPEGSELAELEKMIEDNRLKFCNPENPLHFMTIWTARGYLAKNRLLEHYSRFPRSSVPQTDVQRDAGFAHALSMLECDTNLATSPLTKRYRWFVHFHFPFPAYIHIVHDLRMRPVSDHAQRTWEVLSDNWETQFMFLGQTNNPFFKVFAKIILQAWRAREVAFRQPGKPLVPPRIVSDIRLKLAQTMQDARDVCIKQPNDVFGMDTDYSMSMSVESGCYSFLYDMGGQGDIGSESRPYHNMPGQTTVDVDLNDLDWTSMDWNAMYRDDW